VLLLFPGQPDRSVAIAASGHYRRSAGIEQDLVYVPDTSDALELLDAKAFTQKFKWKNDPDKVRLADRWSDVGRIGNPSYIRSTSLKSALIDAKDPRYQPVTASALARGTMACNRGPGFQERGGRVTKCNTEESLARPDTSRLGLAPMSGSNHFR
jgi:hypothetical protein